MKRSLFVVCVQYYCALMMSISRISRLAFEVASYEARITYKCSYAVIASSRKIVSTIFRQGVRNQSTLSNSTAQIQTQQKSWKSYVKEWRWKIPFGIGFSFLAVLQWRYFRKRQEDATTKGPIEGLMVECYCSLPLRITSRVWGGFASLQLPVSLRSVVYSCYAKMFKANLDEIDASLTEFPSLSDFFVRPLKADARIIADHTNMVAPSDGKVLHFGPITSCKVEQVKGMTYNLQHFLGEPNRPQIDKEDSIAKKPVCDNYVTSLLKNPENILYQLTIYLAPGDYHRFHSPADWTINLRRHFQGKLLSVNPKIASWLPDLFALNERVVYIGEWAGGFMAYTAVGATNVGSIHVYKDGELVTNKRKWPRGKYTEDARFEGGMRVQKGELFGEFRMGSTIVLIFEAPRDFEFSTEVGQQIKMGQALTNGIVVS